MVQVKESLSAILWKADKLKVPLIKWRERRRGKERGGGRVEEREGERETEKEWGREEGGGVGERKIFKRIECGYLYDAKPNKHPCVSKGSFIKHAFGLNLKRPWLNEM